MTFDELTMEQRVDAKGAYLVRLAEKGIFIGTMRKWHPDKYAGESEERDPSYGEMADADELVPDEVMRKDGVDYCEDDFSSINTSKRSDLDRLKHWIIREVTTTEYMSTHPESTWMHDVLVNSAVHAVMSWARLKIIEKCDEMENEE